MTDRRCEQWREAIVDGAVHELPEEEAILLEQHLGECPECDRLAASTRDMLTRWSESATRADAFAVDPAAEAALLRRVRDRARNGEFAAPSAQRRKLDSIWRRISWMTLRPIPAYAAVVMIIASCIAGVWATSRHGHGRSAPVGNSPSAAAPAEPRTLPDPARKEHAPRDRAFTVTPSDALCLIGSLGSDTL